MVTGTQLHAHEVLAEFDDLLLVGPADDHRPVAVVEELLEGDDLAGALVGAGQHHVQRLVEHDLGAAGELGDSDVGVQRHPHLAPAGEHVDGAVVVAAEEGAVRRRGLGELLDLFPQGRDVLAGLTEGVGQLLVLADGLGELTLGLEQPLLEGAHPLGGVLEAAPQGGDLFLQDPDLFVEVLDLAGQAFLVGFVVVSVDGNHLLVDLSATLPSRLRVPVPRRRAVTHRPRGVTGTFGTCASDAAARKLPPQRTGFGPAPGFSPVCPVFIGAPHYSAPCGSPPHSTPLPLPLTKR